MVSSKGDEAIDGFEERENVFGILVLEKDRSGGRER